MSLVYLVPVQIRGELATYIRCWSSFACTASAFMGRDEVYRL